MDWTSLLDDDGHDELLVLNKPKTSRLVDSLSQHHQRYSPWIAFCFTLNYVLGVGALGVPKAFVSAGPVLASIVMLLVFMVTAITVSWMIEILSLAQGIHTAKLLEFDVVSDPLVADELALERSLHSSLETRQKLFEISTKFEVSALTHLILGRKGKIAFQISLSFLMYTGLWAYSAVFVNTLEGIISNRLLNVLIFSALVVPLSCLELTEQWVVQVILTIIRGITFVSMIVATLVAMQLDSFDSDETRVSGPFVSSIPLVEFKGFGLIFTTSVFSLLFQHSVPGLLFPLKDRTKASRVFDSALAVCTAIYIFLGCICSLYFGEKTQSSVNLNWARFSYGYPLDQVPMILKIVNYIILFFPAIDILSVFPLIVVTLGNNLQYSISLTFGLHKRNKVMHYSSRLLSSLPPIIASIFYTELDLILQISGFFGIYIAILNPCLLMFFAKREANSLFGERVTSHYSSMFRRNSIISVIGLCGLAAAIFVIVDIVQRIST